MAYKLSPSKEARARGRAHGRQSFRPDFCHADPTSSMCSFINFRGIISPARSRGPRGFGDTFIFNY